MTWPALCTGKRTFAMRFATGCGDQLGQTRIFGSAKHSDFKVMLCKSHCLGGSESYKLGFPVRYESFSDARTRNPILINLPKKFRQLIAVRIVFYEGGK